MTKPFSTEQVIILPAAATQSRKARQILAGAKAAFLELGFEGASTDDIARRAGVSKGTMYNYFPDKRALFTAFVELECQEQAQRIFEIRAEPNQTDAVLSDIAVNFVTFLLSPFAQGMFRLVIAESQRFPELGRAFYDSGPDLGTRRLAQFFAAATARGELDVADPDMAAYQFAELCKAELFFKCLLGVKRSVTKADISRVANAAVSTFMRAYRP